MLKQFKGTKKTIELTDKKLSIVSSGFLSSSKKEYALNEVTEVGLTSSSFFAPKDSIVLIINNKQEELIHFPFTADIKHIANEIADAVDQASAKSPYKDTAETLIDSGSKLLDIYKEYRQAVRNQNQSVNNDQEAEMPSEEGSLSLTTYINGRPLIYPKSKNGIKAVFLASYARSPRTMDEPWVNEWHTRYNIKDVWGYLFKLVDDGYLEEAVPRKALSVFTVDQLKDMLLACDLKTSGSKQVLVERLLNEVGWDETYLLMPFPVYALTEKGADFLNRNRETLKSIWIDCDKAIESGVNKDPEYKARTVKKKEE